MPAHLSSRTLHIGEGFEGPGVNLAHINVLVGPRNGPAGQAFATALATPSAGHAPFVVIAKPGIPTKPLTLYVNKAPIASGYRESGGRIARRRHATARSRERVGGGNGELGEPGGGRPGRGLPQQLSRHTKRDQGGPFGLAFQGRRICGCTRGIESLLHAGFVERGRLNIARRRRTASLVMET
jgi:hypothetical protein